MKHAESLLPHGKQWKLVWNDEFDGNTLDRGKWDFRLNMMQRRHTALLEGGIHFEDSCIHLELVRDKDQFTGNRRILKHFFPVADRDHTVLPAVNHEKRAGMVVGLLAPVSCDRQFPGSRPFRNRD